MSYEKKMLSRKIYLRFGEREPERKEKNNRPLATREKGTYSHAARCPASGRKRPSGPRKKASESLSGINPLVARKRGDSSSGASLLLSGRKIKKSTSGGRSFQLSSR